MAFLPWWNNGVFSGETMVLGYHMLHLNAGRQLWSRSVPGCGPTPRRSLPLVGKCFQREPEEATFHGATSRCRTPRMRWVHLCVFVFFHVYVITVPRSQAQCMSISLMKEVRRRAFLQVDIMIALLLSAVLDSFNYSVSLACKLVLKMFYLLINVFLFKKKLFKERCRS